MSYRCFVTDKLWLKRVHTQLKLTCCHIFTNIYKEKQHLFPRAGVIYLFAHKLDLHNYPKLATKNRTSNNTCIWSFADNIRTPLFFIIALRGGLRTCTRPWAMASDVPKSSSQAPTSHSSSCCRFAHPPSGHKTAEQNNVESVQLLMYNKGGEGNSMIYCSEFRGRRGAME